MEDVNLKLREQAVRVGANAVINVRYTRGVSATSWKALTADGTAVVLSSADVARDERTPLVPVPDPVQRIRELAELRDAGAITNEEFEETKKRLLGAL